MLMIISIVIVLLLGAGIYYYLNSCNFAKECSYECFSKLLTNQLKETNLLNALDSVDMNKVPVNQKNAFFKFKESINEIINSKKGGNAEIDYNEELRKSNYKTDKTCNNVMNIYGNKLKAIMENLSIVFQIA